MFGIEYLQREVFVQDKVIKDAICHLEWILAKQRRPSRKQIRRILAILKGTL